LSRLCARTLVERINVNVSAVDHRKSAVAVRKGQKQISAPEQHRLGALLLAKTPADREEHVSLRLRDAASKRHLDVVGVHLIECIALG